MVLKLKGFLIFNKCSNIFWLNKNKFENSIEKFNSLCRPTKQSPLPDAFIESQAYYFKRINQLNLKWKKISWKYLLSLHTVGTAMRGGRGGIQRRGSSNSGSYNSNISVTGSDVQQCKYWFYTENCWIKLDVTAFSFFCQFISIKPTVEAILSWRFIERTWRIPAGPKPAKRSNANCPKSSTRRNDATRR